MNKWLYVGALLFGLTACSSDDLVGGDTPNTGDLTMTFTSGNQARILTPNQALGARMQTRAAADPAAPSIPGAAIEFDKEALNNWNDGVLLSKGNSYKITKTYNGSVSTNDMNGNGEVINIYVAADATFTTWWDDWRAINANIYVLPGATLTWCQTGWDNLAKIPEGVKMYVWGNLKTPDNIGLRLYDGSNGAGELYIFNSDSPFTVNKVNGDGTNICFQVDGKAKFYSSREVEIEGTACLLGDVHFAEKAVIDYNLFPCGGANIVFDRCSKVLGQLDNRRVDSAATIDVNECLYLGSLHDDGRPLTINLNEALLDIDEVFSTAQEGYKENRIVDKGSNCMVIHGNDGDYYSIVRILGDATLAIDKNNGSYTTTTVGEWPNQTTSITDYPIDCFTGYINILGTLQNKIYYTPGEGIDLVTLDENNLNPSDTKVHFNDADIYLPGTDCRPAIGDGAIIIAPAHKYSAVSFDFGTDGTLYLCWHSNINTNKEDGEEYSGSVSSSSDWGGIVDVINVNSYNPANSIFEQTMMQDEHKYNHIKFYNGKLYLASTSKKVGAALHELKLSGNKIDESDAGVRVNLIGSSGNCVDILNGKLLTISGFNNGGINYFALNDYSNQEKKAINEASSEFQGKYIYVDKVANKVISLNNTSRGIITIYNASTMAVEKTFEVGSIKPTDGKNVCISDGSNIYICRGQNGFDVYDFNGNKVGGSKKHANGCDVDNNYIYIATGDGFAILDKNVKDAEGNNKTLKVVKFTGTGFVYPGTRGGKMDDSVKNSSNFVKVYNGNVYVAHGMYGLRIYKLSDLVY